MDTIVAMYSMGNRDKDERKLKLRNEKDDYNYNEGNCFLHALKSIEPIYRDKQYDLVFKDKSTPEQVNLADEILRNHGKKLRLIKSGSTTVYKYMKNNKGTKLLIFWEHGGFIHAEGFIDGKTVEKPQIHVKMMMARKCQIREFIITDIDDNGVVDNINLVEEDENVEEK